MATEPPDIEAAERLSEAARRLVDLVRRTGAEGGSAERALSSIEAACSALEGSARPGPWSQRSLALEGSAPDAGAEWPITDFAAFFPYSPLIGPRNPLAPPARLEVRGERIVGRVRPGAAYAGPPGLVHGGVIASLFDELLGCANLARGVPGMTGTLRIVYRAPTPLDCDLELEAWVERIEERKVLTRGAIRCGGVLTAEADGVFVQGAIQRHVEQMRAADSGG